jgi:hypothetical protein
LDVAGSATLVPLARGEHVVSGLSRNEQLIKFFVQASSNRLGRTILVKLIYLADHEARRYTGAPLSTFTWTREPQGPFDPAFYAAKDSLVAKGLILEIPGLTPFGNKWYQYQDAQRFVEYDFSPPERRILEYIVTTYGNRTREEILADVYHTPPMQAVESQPRHTPVPMEMADNVKKKEFGGVDLAELIAAQERFRRGVGVPGDEVIQFLRQGVA